MKQLVVAYLDSVQARLASHKGMISLRELQSATGWANEVRLIRWNDGESKYNIRTEIYESAWSVHYTNESIPFEKPANKGKIAVKVINHYGDKVLKVYEVG